MTQQFNRVRDIIDDYECFWLPVIKKELTECNDEHDYVYGRLLKYKGKQIRRNGLYEKDFESKEDSLSTQDYFDMTNADYNSIFKIMHSEQDIIFTSPNPHQKRCVGKIDNVVNALEPLKIQTWRFTNFEHLYDVIRAIFLVNKHTSSVLTIYDTALRIGYNHKEQILPSKYVYLYGNDQIGPKGGAIALYGQQWVAEHLDKDHLHRIETKWFMDKFPNLPSWEIESILCIYANCFYLNMPY